MTKHTTNLKGFKSFLKNQGKEGNSTTVVYHDLDFLFGKWTAKEYKNFEERTKIFDKIDNEMWK